MGTDIVRKEANSSTAVTGPEGLHMNLNTYGGKMPMAAQLSQDGKALTRTCTPMGREETQYTKGKCMRGR